MVLNGIEDVIDGLSAVSDIRLEQLPRMADFAVWSTACEPAFSVAGSFSHPDRAWAGSSLPQGVVLVP